MIKAVIAWLGPWLFAKALESVADEFLSDEDALSARTKFIEYIKARQEKLTRKGNGFYKAKSQTLRFFAIFMDSDRLRGEAETAAEVAKYAPHDGPGADRAKP